MDTNRRPFQGVLNILSFNRHFYVIGFALLALLVLITYWLHWPASVRWVLVGAFAYGLIMPLLVSAYVYDFSGYYSLDWLKALENRFDAPLALVNINAGFDETSFLLKKIYPNSHLRVFDFYEQERHTEPAIVRARKVSLVYPGTSHTSTASLPLETGAADMILLLSAVHEIRSNDEKARFLAECRRCLKSDGKLVVAEHLRDFPNFLAFTVGFTHFFSRRTWIKAFADAGFQKTAEKKFTPFMSVFTCTTP